MKIYTYTVRIEPAEEGGYNVYVPALPGCVTQGETYEEAVVMAQDAIRCYLEGLLHDGEPIPEDPQQARAATVGAELAVPIAI
ncbi:MAG TPA: type II toxin-antitoxin system HicB family antitoxin [Phycisphaerae bacterium]|jgi:antitoxin HicB|nr:type II toxin-antitoxin system HicB family antitoxin [Phycisphaerae bacterium]HOJ54092.1 type II toxin-antitoxin system HicB family antitoxin [Phycisphaerae bacterium]HOL25615.1 type II toxin-antitoxin system HicB family antitoxin [Phycisphaerae bacterium]HPP22748.1 type II toxin-antitoxin system HicB family antitoxin [Phycisphaerae bacterium]HPU31851.1 type II toxin-antitoxin system HicB family antitoxin [Phycisphaerae bacterium]